MSIKIKRERAHKINGEVRFDEVRLLESDGNSRLMSSYEAYKLAQSMDMDLILMNESQRPPIVKILDYNKFLYDMEKSEKERKRNSGKVEMKEIQLSCDIAINDLMTKSRKCREFIENGNKVRCVIQLKGRQKQMPERGENTIYKFAEILNDIAIFEDNPKLDGGKWSMTLKKKK